MIPLLADAQPMVRAAVLDMLMALRPPASTKLTALLETVLQEDESSLQVRAAGVLVALGQPTKGRAALADFLGHADPSVRALAVITLRLVANEAAGYEGIVAALHDESPVVRRSACNALMERRQPQTVEALIVCLSDSDATVRAAAASVLQQNRSATMRLLQILKDGSGVAQDGALVALSPDGPEQTLALRVYAEQQMENWAETHRLARAITRNGSTTKLLRKALEVQAGHYEQLLVNVLGLLGNSETMKLIGKSLETSDVQIHAAAVEALETLGDRQLVKKFVPLLDSVQTEQATMLDSVTLETTVTQLLESNNPWICALAARTAGEMALQEAVPQLHTLSNHADPLIQASTNDALELLGVPPTMKTLQTISLMERILLLHEVPLLTDLLPEDLKQIADIAHEHLYLDGAVVCREREPGNELFIIVGGKVRVVKNNGEAEKLVAVREAGDFFGEMAIIEAAPRFATVQAEGETRVLSIDGDAFKTILRDRPEVSLGVIRSLSRRLRE